MTKPQLKVKSFDIDKRVVWEAWQQVRANQGAPGVDEEAISEFEGSLEGNLYKLWNRLSSGAYMPPPMKAVQIPKKDGGGVRTLGVPTVADRVAQTVARLYLEPKVEPMFHPDSYGYRPDRSALDAVGACRERCWKSDWVIDLDLRSFFDRVQWDALMARVARRVHDKQVLKLIRRYLGAGVMDGGVAQAGREGTPQGSPLSPLLSNVMLDDLDWELERRGHRFVRYADDGKVYVASERAGQRVMQSITRYVEDKLKLRVNRQKSAVDLATKRPLLGFRFLRRGDGVVVAVDWKARMRAKGRLRRLTSRRWRVSMERRIAEINRFTVGWTAYFSLADTPSPFEELDKWLRRRLRQVKWKEWIRVRTRLRKLRAAGIPEADARKWANSRKGYWRISNSTALHLTLPKSYWADLGLRGFSDPYRRFRVMPSEPPDADPHVRWCGGDRGEPGPYPIKRHSKAPHRRGGGK